MIVWRMEHKETGIGPYQGSADHCIGRMWSDHTDRENHPTPSDEIGMRAWQGSGAWAGEFYYGCATRAQLFEWFKGYLLGLWAAGYRPRAYTVPDDRVFTGRRQVTYLRSAATRL